VRGRGYAAEQAGHRAATGAQTKPMPSPPAPRAGADRARAGENQGQGPPPPRGPDSVKLQITRPPPVSI